MTSATKQIQRILVPLDGSPFAEQSIPYAAAIAGNDETIIFLHVAPGAEPIRDMVGRISLQSNEVKNVEFERSQDELEAAAARWTRVFVTEPRIEIVEGDPATEIINAAGRFECNLIVAASHGRGAVARLAFGSVADKLARSSMVPVMLVRPSDANVEIAKPNISRIVVPYDGSDLAAEALPVAAELAQRLAIGVHLIQAINPASMMTLATPMEPAYPVELYDELISEVETDAKKSLEDAKSQLSAGGLKVSYELVEGTPIDAITDRVQSNDVIVMSSHGRSGIKRWLLGSVAEKLVREGQVPVVLVPASDRHKAAHA